MPQSVNNSVADETHISPRLGVIECSISARIESATITSSEIIFTSEFADFADYQILANGIKESSQPILFHNHWLDSTSAITRNQTAQNRSLIATVGVTFPPRNESALTDNPTLQLFAKTAITPYMLQEKLLHRGQQWLTVEAAELETTLGGVFASILLYLPPSDSQYTPHQVWNYRIHSFPDRNSTIEQPISSSKFTILAMDTVFRRERVNLVWLYF